MLLIYWGFSMKWMCIHTIKVTEKIVLLLFSDAKHFSSYRIKEVARESLAQGGSSLEH
jgi:hypothetical protein